MPIENRVLIYEKDGNSLKPIKIYYDSNGRKWIESRSGTKFVVEIKNNDSNTYLAVVSVDGFNAINGSVAKLEPSNGYILHPKSSMKINGWRISLDNVREFIFSDDINESYAHKLGADESNIGVIGLAFFKEKIINFNYTTNWPPTYPSWEHFSTVYSTCVYDSNKSFSMSTSQGDFMKDEVINVEKEFQNIVYHTDIIYYDSRENLMSRGIIKENFDKLPQPFAKSNFCPSL